MKVAIVHPWFIGQGGGEKVIDALATLYPQADFFALMQAADQLSPTMQARRITSTFLDAIPGAHRYYQHLSPFYALATQSLDVAGYDLVISSGGPATKGVVVGQHALHVHYCHSPVRFLWDQFQVWRQRLPAPLRPLFSAAAMRQREWDFASAQRVDGFIANSDFIGRRISTYYRRDSTTIYPPVAVQPHYSPAGHDDYYLTVGRLVPGKRTELLIEACNQLGRSLVVVGAGPQEARLKALCGPTITLAGRVGEAQLDALFRKARAFVFAAEEDFGIATVEAQSYGLPAIVLGRGGSAEIVAGPEHGALATGIIFDEQTVAGVVGAIQHYEAAERRFDRMYIWQQSRRFSASVFAERMSRHIDALLHAHRARLAASPSQQLSTLESNRA